VCQVVWLDKKRLLWVAASQKDLTHTLRVKQYRHHRHNRLSIKWGEVLVPQLAYTKSNCVKHVSFTTVLFLK
jgi:hypothetical protein